MVHGDRFKRRRASAAIVRRSDSEVEQSSLDSAGISPRETLRASPDRSRRRDPARLRWGLRCSRSVACTRRSGPGEAAPRRTRCPDHELVGHAAGRRQVGGVVLVRHQRGVVAHRTPDGSNPFHVVLRSPADVSLQADLLLERVEPRVAWDSASETTASLIVSNSLAGSQKCPVAYAVTASRRFVRAASRPAPLPPCRGGPTVRGRFR